MKYALIRMNDSQIVERFSSRAAAVRARDTWLADGTIKGAYGIVHIGAQTALDEARKLMKAWAFKAAHIVEVKS